uniref:Retrotransposon Copia-like N-terminal domain-containing protein n=1 Tax=Triticum urartu TaxID=4572 RepID=A0A8R7U9Q9_TRIUA
MNRLLRRSRSADLDAAANLPPLAPLAAIPPAHAAPGMAGLHPRAPAPAPVRLGQAAPAALAAVDAAPLAAPLHRGVGRELIPCLDIPGAPAPGEGLPPSITHFLRFKLDLAAGNYSRWRHLFYFILCKYNVQHHVDENREPLHEDANWRNDDITIVLWIYSTISDELYDVVMSPASTAHQVWHTLRLFFLDNQA